MEICMTCEKANDFEKMSIQSASMPLDPYSSAPDDEDDDFDFTYSSDEDDDLEGDEEDDDDDEDGFYGFNHYVDDDEDEA